MRVALRISLLTLAMLLCSPAVTADPPGPRWHHGAQGWEPEAPYGRHFNPSGIIVLTGEIERIDTFVPAEGMSVGVYLTLRSTSGTVMVHLGPLWYLEHQEIPLEPGTAVSVRGSSILFGDAPVIMATELRTTGYVLRLRNAAGIPYWIGWRH